MQPGSSILSQLVEKANRLYTLPSVALETLELCSQPRVDLQALKACIERDPALTCRLLKTVNSSLFGLRRQVTDLNQALSLLGTKPLKMLVLTFSLPEELFAGQEAEALARYWKHTLIKAVACRELAEQVWGIPGDDPFIAGLVQDIGQLVLLQQLGESYRNFLTHAYERGGDVLALEMETLGFDHAILSARLLDHWGLPESLVKAVGRPMQAELLVDLFPHERVLPQILHLAELLARLFTQHHPYALRDVLDTGEKYKGLTYEQLQDLVTRLDEKVAALGEVFALYSHTGPTLVELLSRAHAQLGDLALDLYGDVTRLSDELKTALQVAPWSWDHESHTGTGENFARGTGDTVPFGNARGAHPEPARGGTLTAADPGLLGRIAAAVATCRQARRPVSLVLLEVDGYSDLLLTLGPQRAAPLVRLMEAAATQLSPHRATCLTIGDARFALLWENCDRREAGEAARLLGRSLAQWLERRGEPAALTFSIGIATLVLPPKNFAPADLLSPAERCLYGAQASGGDCVKSIDV